MVVFWRAKQMKLHAINTANNAMNAHAAISRGASQPIVNGV